MRGSWTTAEEGRRDSQNEEEEIPQRSSSKKGVKIEVQCLLCRTDTDRGRNPPDIRFKAQIDQNSPRGGEKQKRIGDGPNFLNGKKKRKVLSIPY